MKFDMVVIKSTKDAGTGTYHHDNTPFGVDFSGTHLPVSGLGEAMGSNSLRAVLAMGAALAFSAAPAHAELVNAKNPATIKAILESQGWPATLVSKPGEDPYLESNRNGLKFVVLFMNCTENKNCKTLQYYMGFSDAKNVALDRFNEWNRTKRFARAYRDLVAKGKPKKLALVATMRKLLVTLNAIARHNTPWREQTQQTLKDAA